jgi:hypothetical protein
MSRPGTADLEVMRILLELGIASLSAVADAVTSVVIVMGTLMEDAMAVKRLARMSRGYPSGGRMRVAVSAVTG